MDEFFVVGLAAVIGLFLRWSFKTLPKEGWQILASIPLVRTGPSTWQGVNITYYGLLIAISVVVANAVMLLLLGALRIPLGHILLLQSLMFLICLPSARLIALHVEKKHHTFFIGGTAFIGIFLSPCLIWLTNKLMTPLSSVSLPLIPTLAAMSIAYALGEGLGRVACISFGCCYGKSLDRAPCWVKRLFQSYNFVFEGKTKKVSYEGRMEGKKLIPVQGLTSVCYVAAGLIGMLCYLKGYYVTALGISLITTQAWRAFSEIFRDDWRGGGRFSTYQYMAMIAVICSVIFLWMAPAIPVSRPDFMVGILFLWNPAVIFVLTGIGIVVFGYTGISTVTSSELKFYVVKERS